MEGKIMKTFKTKLLTIVALLCSISANAHDFEVDGIYYDITSETDSTVSVTFRGPRYDDYDNEYSGTITIPPIVNYNSNTYRVTSIGETAFYGCKELTSITIPEGMTRIEYNAFSGCSSLTSITIPRSVFYISSGSFSGCCNISSMIVDAGNTQYDSRNGCNAIIETISNALLHGCSSTVIPEGVTRIEYNAFYYCSSLTSITIPEGVTSIGSSAFNGCSSLTSITIPEGVTSIEEYAFGGCSSLTSITIPEGVTSIEYCAFDGCSSLTSITIPEGVTSIEGDAFYLCN